MEDLLCVVFQLLFLVSFSASSLLRVFVCALILHGDIVMGVFIYCV